MFCCARGNEKTERNLNRGYSKIASFCTVRAEATTPTLHVVAWLMDSLNRPRRSLLYRDLESTSHTWVPWNTANAIWGGNCGGWKIEKLPDQGREKWGPEQNKSENMLYTICGFSIKSTMSISKHICNLCCNYGLSGSDVVGEVHDEERRFHRPA